MAKDTLNQKIDDLFQKSKWHQARRLLEKERDKNPDDHWILTQLGVTFYEEGNYQEALSWFLKSLRIVESCPLTLWNIAGTLDALGKYNDAVRIFSWLLESQTSPEEDPCWENSEWSNSLKADCVYRLGVCFQHQEKRQKAEHCFRQYLDLLVAGLKTSYTLEDVRNRLQDLHGNGHVGVEKKELKKAVDLTLRFTRNGGEKKMGKTRLPRLSARKLLSQPLKT
jgi:tetratricopeptide (TPR) repeat protein